MIPQTRQESLRTTDGQSLVSFLTKGGPKTKTTDLIDRNHRLSKVILLSTPWYRYCFRLRGGGGILTYYYDRKTEHLTPRVVGMITPATATCNLIPSRQKMAKNYKGHRF